MSDSEEEVLEKQLKLVFLGDSNVGKSNIIQRFCYNEFSRQYVQTVGADFHMKRFVLPARRDITLRITDVGGSELDGSMLDKYLYNSNIIILIYDITNAESFDCLSAWVDAIANVVKCPPIIAIIGNKCDLEHQRSVNLQNVTQFSKDLNLLSYIVSAKTGESVTASIVDMVARYVGIPLTKAEKELQHPIVRAELIPITPEIVKISNNKKSHASMCRIQ